MPTSQQRLRLLITAKMVLSELNEDHAPPSLIRRTHATCTVFCGPGRTGWLPAGHIRSGRPRHRVAIPRDCAAQQTRAEGRPGHASAGRLQRHSFVRTAMMIDRSLRRSCAPRSTNEDSACAAACIGRCAFAAALVAGRATCAAPVDWRGRGQPCAAVRTDGIRTAPTV